MILLTNKQTSGQTDLMEVIMYCLVLTVISFIPKSDLKYTGKKYIGVNLAETEIDC